MKLNRKLWTAALAVAMTTPSAMAAQDTAGMHYTSAAEGFYASIRVRYLSNNNAKDGGSDIQDSGSRFGVRGTNDLGGGLEGFYQYEAGSAAQHGSTAKTRLGLVGLRGDFGSVVAGAFWPDTYNWVYGSTDVANRQSGSIVFGDTADDVGHGLGQYRTNKSLQYTTPDLNGFQGAVLIKADKDQGDANDDGKDDNDVDHWSLAAKYDIAGFSTAFSYANSGDGIVPFKREAHSALEKAVEASRTQEVVDGVTMNVATSIDPDSFDPDKKDDLTGWALKLGYSQDNWYVNGWYGESNKSDVGAAKLSVTTTPVGGGEGTNKVVDVKFDDTEMFSIAGGISVDKVKVYAVHETVRYSVSGLTSTTYDDSYSTLGVQYTLGSNSWTWVEYAGRDLGAPDSRESDAFSIGLGHNF